MTITAAPTTDTTRGLSSEQLALEQLAQVAARLERASIKQLAQTAAHAEQELIAAVSDWVAGRAPQGRINEAHDALMAAMTASTQLPSCPDQVPWCTRHEVTRDAGNPDHVAIYNVHQSELTTIPITAGIALRPADCAGRLATVRVWSSLADPLVMTNGPLIEVEFKGDAMISGTPDQPWLTADEARALAGELIRAADMAERADAGLLPR